MRLFLNHLIVDIFLSTTYNAWTVHRLNLLNLAITHKMLVVTVVSFIIDHDSTLVSVKYLARGKFMIR